MSGVESDRRVRLREWAALNDLVHDEYGTELAVASRRRANRVLDELEPLTDADWGVIRLAQREYAQEASR